MARLVDYLVICQEVRGKKYEKSYSGWLIFRYHILDKHHGHKRRQRGSGFRKKNVVWATGMGTRLRAGKSMGLWFSSRLGQMIFTFAEVFRPVLESTLLPVQLTWRTPSRE